VALGTPAYVVRIDPQSNTVVLGAHDDLAVEGLDAARCNWLVDQPNRGFACQVQTRYNGRPADAQVEVDPQSDHLCVRFDQPQHGVAPGQAVVCYDGDRLLGGGWIERTF
jgi:tRNA-specific 2-thiouridylase